MADKKISELNALAAAAAADELAIVDVTAPAETKKITYTNLTKTFLPASVSGAFLPTAVSGAFLTSETDPVFAAVSGAFLPASVSGAFLPTAVSGAFLIAETDPIWAAQSGVVWASMANVISSGATLLGHFDGASGSITSNIGAITGASGSITANIGSIAGASGSITANIGAITGASGASVAHYADSSDPHGAVLTQTGILMASGARTADFEVASQAYLANFIYGTGATPPTASGFTRGTIYVQYTA